MSDLIARTALSRMNQKPVMVSENQAGDMASNMVKLASVESADVDQSIELEEQVYSQVCTAYGFDNRDRTKPFIYQDGVAIIPVHGTLINRFGGTYGFVTGYNYIQRMRALAEIDDDVDLIVYDHHSGGGEVTGAFETAKGIYEGRGKKPSMAVVDSASYSASYMQAVAADKIIVTPTGGVGSVGVWTMHVDMSKMLDDWGLNITLVHSGDHKVDGHPFAPLPDDVKADMQKRVDKTRSNFVDLVAEYRGLSVETVRNTEARCYDAETALEMGLIDGIATPLEAIQEFFNISDNGATKMSKETGKADDQVVQDSADAKGGETPVDQEAVKKEGASAERQRIAAIMQCDAAESRPKLASHLALSTSMSVDDAKGILAAAPAETGGDKEGSNAEDNHFEDAMNRTGNPDVGADISNGQEMSEQDKNVNSLMSSYTAATGETLN